ncbi:SDR family NAD(P)-dependent oxidoreductase [Sodalis sp. C49]|uniref:SDR family NAD(P)-dependent oxidoreductase n=1 Tax=unclassified Sodalis (in: enterobacteria) TaxID=2636512 RepID=UPI003965949B
MSTSENQPTALIIGASRGLGLGLTERFLERGWQVIATEREGLTRPELRQLAARDSHLSVETLDMNSDESLEELYTRLAGKTLDLLMVNAGTVGSPDESFAQRLLTVMRTNVVGAMSALRILSPTVRADGVVAVMSSELASIAANTQGGWEPYRSSKSALNQSLRSFIAENPQTPWSLTAVAPGWVRTEMGGPDALLDIETSTRGVTEMLMTRFNQRGIAFLNYQGKTLEW